MSSQDERNGWFLEVAKGREIGHRYAMAGADLALGNALGATPGIDLSSQEGESPRGMTARHAQLERDPQGVWVIRDLDSLSGTFVNRQRLLSGQTRALHSGDLIQLGPVHLKLVAHAPPENLFASAPPPALAASTPAKPLPSPARTAVSANGNAGRPLAFPMPGGVVCRTWDDFLKVSSQRWLELRDELVSGRLTDHLEAIGRTDLVPDPQGQGSPDERLDQWLGRLPTTLASAPELEIHPETLAVPFAHGGRTQRKLRILNVGHRLLRCSSIRIEPANAEWIRVPAPWSAQPFTTIDETEIPIEIAMPEGGEPYSTAAVVIDSNGGAKRAAIVITKAATVAEPDFGSDAQRPRASVEAPTWMSRPRTIPAARRALVGAFWFLTLRAGAEQSNRVLADSGWTLGSSETAFPLLGPILMMLILGACAGFVIAIRRGRAGDFLAMTLSGAIAGLPAAALMTALVRSIEFTSNPAGLTFSSACALWLLLGGLAGWLSAFLAPPRIEPKPEAAS